VLVGVEQQHGALTDERLDDRVASTGVELVGAQRPAA